MYTSGSGSYFNWLRNLMKSTPCLFLLHSCEAVNDRANQGTGSNTNSNTQRGGIQQQEDTRVEETVTKADPCAHLRSVNSTMMLLFKYFTQT